MTLLIFVLLVLVVLALAIYAVRQLSILDGVIQQLAIVVLIMIAILAICQRAGLLR